MKHFQPYLSSVLAMVLTLTCALPVAASASSFSDIRGHWAAQHIADAVEHGYVDGYEDGRFLPNKSVTRAEFCKMMNQALSLNNSIPINFSDTSSAAWYHNEIAKAVAAGYISGYEDNSFRPDQAISRQEAAVVLSRIITEAEYQNDLSTLRDANSIDDWAKDGAQTAFSKGYMAGDNQRNFNPQGNLTRAEAVKILEGILSTEQIHHNTLDLSSDETLSNGLYTGTVDVSSGGSVNLQNCRVLGTLSVSGSSTLDLQDSRVAKLSLEATSGGSAITASGKSDIAFTQASSGGRLIESGLSGEGFRTVELNGARLFTQPLQLSGLFDRVNIASPSRLSLRAGSITLLQLESGAGSSQIELLTGTSVARAELNAAANFTGHGIITLAILSDKGSTFETKPTRLEGDESGNVGISGLFPSVTPSSGSTGVAPSTDITLTFNEVPYTSTNGTVTTSYVENNVVEVRRGSETGNKVPFSVSLSSNNRVIVISPDSNLDSSSKYYVIVKPSLRSNIGQTNARHVFSFSTTNGLTPTVYPADGATLIPVNTVLRLEFSEAVYQSNGTSSLNSSYLSSSVIELHRESQSGRSVAFSSSISSNHKTITIDPSGTLDTSTKYYLVIRANSLANSARDTLPEQVYSFTTASSSILVPSMTPSNGATKVSLGTDILLDFDTPIYNSSGSAVTTSYLKDSVFTLRRDSASGSTVGFSASISSDRERVTLTPSSSLRADTSYYLVMSDSSLCDGTGSGRRYNGRLVLSFTTSKEENRRNLDPTVSPRNAASNVSADTDITLEFDTTAIYQANSSGSEITNSYLRDSVLELREDSASGERISFSASLSSNRRMVTLTPTYNLERDTRYYVIVREGSIQNSSRERNEKFTSYFTVGTTGGGGLRNPDVSPSNGSSGVSANTDITLEFGQTLYDTNGTLISSLSNPSSYLQNCFDLRAGSETGAQVNFSANLYNSGRSVTIDPTENLPGGITYYLILKEGYFRSSDAEYNRRMVYHFSVGSSLTLSSTIPSSGASGVSVGSSIVLNFNEAIYNSGGGVLSLNDLTNSLTLTDNLPYTISVAGSTLTITPTKPLTTNKTYTVTLASGCIKGASGGLNSSASFNFSTSQDTSSSVILAPTMAVDPATKSITLTFNSNLLKADKSALDEPYIYDKLKLTETNTNGATVYYTAKSRDGVITLTIDDMKPDTTYCATAIAGSFANSSGGTTEAFGTTVRSPEAKVTLSVPNVGTDSATFQIAYNYPISFNFTLTPKDGDKIIRNNLIPKQSPFQFEQDKLDPNMEYTVSLTYSMSNEAHIPIDDVTFKTLSRSSNNALQRVTIEGTEGSTFHDFGDDEFNVTIPGIKTFIKPSDTSINAKVKLKPNIKNSRITINGTQVNEDTFMQVTLNKDGSETIISINILDINAGMVETQYDLTLKL